MFGKKNVTKDKTIADNTKVSVPKMLLDSEHLLEVFELEYNKKLNLTVFRLVSSHMGKIKDEIFDEHMGIPLEYIQMITPVKKNVILVQFVMRYYGRHDTDIHMKHQYMLKNNDAVEIADKLKESLTRTFTYTANDHGRLLTKEKIINTFPALADKGDGILYVTRESLYFELSKQGIQFQIPYLMYRQCVMNKNTLVIKYEETHTDGKNHEHEFKLQLEHIKSAYDLITKSHLESLARRDIQFEYLEGRFSHMSGKDLKKILVEKRKDAPQVNNFSGFYRRIIFQCNKNALELEEYVYKLAQRMFGHTRPKTEWCYCSLSFPRESIWGVRDGNPGLGAGRPSWCVGMDGSRRYDPEEWYKTMPQINADYPFITLEARLVLCALLADVPLETIGTHTESYLQMVQEFQKDFDEHRQAEMDFVEAHIKIKEMDTQAVDAESYKHLLKNPDHEKYVHQLEECKKTRERYYPKSHRTPPFMNGSTDPHSKFQELYNDVDFNFTYHHWKKTYATRMEVELLTLSRRIYDAWKKDIDLENFTDDSDPSWIHNILAEYPYPKRYATVLPDMKSAIEKEFQRSEGVKKSLESFSIPDIPTDDITNNDCWFDRKLDMWFTMCEKAYLASKFAAMQPDESRTSCGYVALGFKKEQVTMIHGFPAVQIPYDVFPLNGPNDPYHIPQRKRYVIITAVPSSSSKILQKTNFTENPVPSVVSDDVKPIVKYPITKEMLIDSNYTVRITENAPYSNTIKTYFKADKQLIIDQCDYLKKTGKFGGDYVNPVPLFLPILEYETLEPELGIMNGGLMIDNPLYTIYNPRPSPDELVRNGMMRGVPTCAESDDSPLSIAVKINAERLGENYPSKLLPLYERLRRHLFSVTTLCGVLTKPTDYNDAVQEFSINRSSPQDDMLSYVDVDESRSDKHEQFKRYWENFRPHNEKK